MANQFWEFREFPGPHPNGEDNAVIFLNAADRQGHGEASAALRGDGSVGLFYLEPGSLGASISPNWTYQDFPGPNGAKAAVIFLNEPDRQGRGEVTATLRADGTASLLTLEPGSLGASTAHAWCFKDFPAPHGVRDALAFLNAHPRQGEGEVSGYARTDGSAVIFYLEPGSI